MKEILGFRPHLLQVKNKEKPGFAVNNTVVVNKRLSEYMENMLCHDLMINLA